MANATIRYVSVHVLAIMWLLVIACITAQDFNLNRGMTFSTSLTNCLQTHHLCIGVSLSQTYDGVSYRS